MAIPLGAVGFLVVPPNANPHLYISIENILKWQVAAPNITVVMVDGTNFAFSNTSEAEFTQALTLFGR